MKKVVIIVMAFLVSIGLAPMTNVHAEETSGPFEVDGKTYPSFESAVAAAQSSNTGVIELIANATVDNGVEIGLYDDITLDLNHYKMTTSSSFSGDLILNEGSLTITGESNGVIDLSQSPNAKNGIYNYGYVNMTGGILKSIGAHISVGISNREGSSALLEGTTKLDGFTTNVFTTANAETTITGGTYVNDYYTSVDNLGTTTITGGTFINTSCSACNPSAWGYTVRSQRGHMEIDGQNVKVYGVQGALAIVGGTANVRGGHFETKICPKHPDGSTAFYALYVAGEVGQTTAHIYDGEFISVTRTAALVGNKNVDGGQKLGSNCYIHGGKFTTNGGDNISVVTADENGNAFINGGSFNKELINTFITEGYQQSLDSITGYYVVSKVS